MWDQLTSMDALNIAKKAWPCSGCWFDIIYIFVDIKHERWQKLGQ
jgi:hypothetical protein